LTEAPQFGPAVAALQAGDRATLERLLDADPRLLHERVRGGDYPDYFRDPKLFWFIANNPVLTAELAPSMPEVTRALIARGVDDDDLDYALELVMTGCSAREAGLQEPLIHLLLDSGAKADARAVDMALAHRELGAVRVLIARGAPINASMAAAFGWTDDLPALLAADPPAVQMALAQAVINARPEALRMCLEAGADPRAHMPVHAHATPLHQAAYNGDLDSLALLVAHGARTDVRDRMWQGTPLDWAKYAGAAEAAAWLEGR
jgi:peptide-methionine (S)-S-oxide reductase